MAANNWLARKGSRLPDPTQEVPVSNSFKSHPLNSIPQPDRVDAPGSVEAPLIEPATPKRSTQSRIPTARKTVSSALASLDWRLHPAQFSKAPRLLRPRDSSSARLVVRNTCSSGHRQSATDQRDLVVRNLGDTTQPRLELSERSETASPALSASAASAGNIASSVVGVVGSIVKAADSVMFGKTAQWEDRFSALSSSDSVLGDRPRDTVRSPRFSYSGDDENTIVQPRPHQLLNDSVVSGLDRPSFDNLEGPTASWLDGLVAARRVDQTPELPAPAGSLFDDISPALPPEVQAPASHPPNLSQPGMFTPDYTTASVGGPSGPVRNPRNAPQSGDARRYYNPTAATGNQTIDATAPPVTTPTWFDRFMQVQVETNRQQAEATVATRALAESLCATQTAAAEQLVQLRTEQLKISAGGELKPEEIGLFNPDGIPDAKSAMKFIDLVRDGYTWPLYTGRHCRRLEGRT